MRSLDRCRSERGEALIAGLLALGLVLLTVAFGAQAVIYAHARAVAVTAAQEGASQAAMYWGSGAGVRRATAVLRAAGGIGRELNATAQEDINRVTVTVSGRAPRLFRLPLPLPPIHARASLPVEDFPQ